MLRFYEDFLVEFVRALEICSWVILWQNPKTRYSCYHRELLYVCCLMFVEWINRFFSRLVWPCTTNLVLQSLWSTPELLIASKNRPPSMLELARIYLFSDHDLKCFYIDYTIDFLFLCLVENCGVFRMFSCH